MKRVKLWWMMPWELQPRFREYFRVGPYIGWCALKTPWLVVMIIPKEWEYEW